MSSSQASRFTLKWGIVATGWISQTFVSDILVQPSTRGVNDIKHSVVAVASRSVEKAEQFVDDAWKKAGLTDKEGVKTYGSYDELYRDQNVDVVYIGSPHSLHFKDVHAALSAGKNVLCEKPCTVNADQIKILVDLARTKKVFFMEAVWTRFQPIASKLREILDSGAIGKVTQVEAQLCRILDAEARNPAHRLVNPTLAGGALLDLGPYPWTWLAMTLLDRTSTPLTTPLPALKISSSLMKGPTGVDHSTAAIIQFPQADGTVVHGTLIAGFEAQTIKKRAIVILGTKGFIEIEDAAYRSSGLTYSAWNSEDEYTFFRGEPSHPVKEERFDYSTFPGDITGYSWEADEVARCIRDKKLESDRMPLRETVLMMEVFDEIRKQNGFEYPAPLESLQL
ncbi:NAD-binding protein [Meredithblackwellia eburnea MCA 4105]